MQRCPSLLILKRYFSSQYLYGKHQYWEEGNVANEHDFTETMVHSPYRHRTIHYASMWLFHYLAVDLDHGKVHFVADSIAEHIEWVSAIERRDDVAIVAASSESATPSIVTPPHDPRNKYPSSLSMSSSQCSPLSSSPLDTLSLLLQSDDRGTGENTASWVELSEHIL